MGDCGMRNFTPDVVWLDTNLLLPYELNSKTHPPDQVARLAKNMEKFGFDIPIMADQHYTIISGHGRLLAAKKLRMEKVPVIVRYDLTPEEVQIRRLNDNSLALSGFNIDLLLPEINEMVELGIDQETLGFPPGYLDKLKADLEGELRPKNEKHLEKDLSEQAEKEYIIACKCKDESELKSLYDELVERGYEIKIFN
jgi:ParB-like chromosome segregation protein Spo0J